MAWRAMDRGRPLTGGPCGRLARYRPLVASVGADPGEEAELPVPSFQSQVALWFAVWSADRPDLVARARVAADPRVDPWGYLAALGQLLADAA